MDPVRLRRPVMYILWMSIRRIVVYDCNRFEIETGNGARVQHGVDQESQA